MDFRLLCLKKKKAINNCFLNQWKIEQMAIAREVNLKFCIISSIVVIVICKIRGFSIIYKIALKFFLCSCASSSYTSHINDMGTLCCY